MKTSSLGAGTGIGEGISTSEPYQSYKWSFMIKTISIIVLNLFLFGCSAQDNYRSKYLDNDEVRFFVKKHPKISYEEFIACDFPKVMYNAGIQFIGISGLLIGYAPDSSEFQDRYNQIVQSYAFHSNLGNSAMFSTVSECQFDTLIPDVMTILKYSYFKIASNSDVYLLKNELGAFIDEEHLTYPYPCDHVQHGSSCGAFVDKKNLKLIYWIIFW